MTAEEIAKMIDLPVHIVERHLFALIEKGLVKKRKKEKEGRNNE